MSIYKEMQYLKRRHQSIYRSRKTVEILEPRCTVVIWHPLNVIPVKRVTKQISIAGSLMEQVS